MRPLLLGCFAATAVVGCGGGSESPSGQLDPAQRAALCRSAQQGLSDAGRDEPSLPVEELRRIIRESCENGTFGTPVPPAAPPRIVQSPGCKASTGDERAGSAEPRTAKAPDAEVPFFARRSGALPRDGSPTIAGVTLPRGSRCPHAWVTDEPVDDPRQLVSRLAAAFPRTGLWPVLWAWGEDPDHYLDGAGEADAGAAGSGSDRVRGGPDARSILRRLWARFARYRENRAAIEPFGRAFAGLARPSPGARRGAAASNPFGVLAHHPVEGLPNEKPWLVLVPANRPADIPDLLAFGLTENAGNDEISTVLRSWEERFGVVLVEMTPSTLTLVVDRPPVDKTQALRLSAEHWALAPQQDGSRPGTVSDVAGVLLDGQPISRDWGPELRLAPQIWELGWSD